MILARDNKVVNVTYRYHNRKDVTVMMKRYLLEVHDALEGVLRLEINYIVHIPYSCAYISSTI